MVSIILLFILIFHPFQYRWEYNSLTNKFHIFMVRICRAISEIICDRLQAMISIYLPQNIVNTGCAKLMSAISHLHSILQNFQTNSAFPRMSCRILVFKPFHWVARMTICRHFGARNRKQREAATFLGIPGIRMIITSLLHKITWSAKQADRQPRKPLLASQGLLVHWVILGLSNHPSLNLI
jgi:hypothetical protein